MDAVPATARRSSAKEDAELQVLLDARPSPPISEPDAPEETAEETAEVTAEETAEATAEETAGETAEVPQVVLAWPRLASRSSFHTRS